MLLLLSGAALVAPDARADIKFTIEQVGNDVVTTGAGAIDLAGLKFQLTTTEEAGVSGGFATVATGPAGNQPIRTSTDFYTGVTGPTSFGTRRIQLIPTIGQGDYMAVSGANGYLYVPEGYTSNTHIMSTDTYSNKTISGLGLATGNYTYTWGTGGPDHTLTVQIGAVPEPSTGVVAVFGAVALIAYRWSRHCRAQRRPAAT
jgi:hypothetical protein